VIAIIGALVALLLPAIQAARESARRTECLSHLKQIGISVTSFHETVSHFPPARIEFKQGDLPSLICGGMEPSWFAYILPYVEQASAAESWQLLEPYSLHELAIRSYAPSIFSCPSRGANELSKNVIRNVNLPCGCGGPIGNGPAGAIAHYAANHGDLSPGYSGSEQDFYWGGNGTGVIISVRAVCQGFYPVFPLRLHDRISSKDVSDGISKTLLVGELHVTPDEQGISPDNGPMYDGQQLPSSARLGGPGMAISSGPDDSKAAWLFDRHSNYGFGSWHPGICPFVFADGSARALDNDTEPAVLGQLCNRSDGLVTSLP
jgi:hypothetical protein